MSGLGGCVLPPVAGVLGCHSERGIIGTTNVEPPAQAIEIASAFFNPKEKPQSGRALLLAWLVWHAVVEDGGDAEEATRKLIADMRSKVLFPPPDALVEWLAQRKVFRFGDDHRLIRPAELDRDVDRAWDIVTSLTRPAAE